MTKVVCKDSLTQSCTLQIGRNSFY